MPRSDHNGMIDGFMSVQAVRRLDGHPSRPDPSAHPSAEKEAGKQPAPASSAPNASPAASKATFGHTALPTRHDLICYECGYRFVVTGRLDKVFCPKCKTQLETGDHVIEGNWSGSIKTVGNVFIQSGAVVTSAHIVAMDIGVAGVCRDSRLEPTRHLKLASGAQLALEVLAERDVVIVEESRIVLDEPLRCRSLDIHGELQADVYLADRASIQSTGRFHGSLHARNLRVYEGASLKARVHIAPNAQPREHASDQPPDASASREHAEA